MSASSYPVNSVSSCRHTGLIIDGERDGRVSRLDVHIHQMCTQMTAAMMLIRSSSCDGVSHGCCPRACACFYSSCEEKRGLPGRTSRKRKDTNTSTVHHIVLSISILSLSSSATSRIPVAWASDDRYPQHHVTTKGDTDMVKETLNVTVTLTAW